MTNLYHDNFKKEEDDRYAKKARENMVDHMISPAEYDWYIEQNTKELLG